MFNTIKMNAKIESEQVLENCQKYSLLTSNSYTKTNIRKKKLTWVAIRVQHLVL